MSNGGYQPTPGQGDTTTAPASVPNQPSSMHRMPEGQHRLDWRKWAMEGAWMLVAGGVPLSELESIAQRSYDWTLSKSG